jgi:Co/Zn/Cd efflux system component
MLRVLMEAAPPGTNTRKIADALESEVPGVMGVHCLHLWEISPGKAALMAHVHVQTQTRGEAGTENAGVALERALSRATRLLQTKFGINHTTLQMTAMPEQGGWAACGAVGKQPVKCAKCDEPVDAASNV